MGTIRRVDDLRRVVIPRPMCEQIGIDICDKVELEVVEGGILIKPCKGEDYE